MTEREKMLQSILWKSLDTMHLVTAEEIISVVKQSFSASHIDFFEHSQENCREQQKGWLGEPFVVSSGCSHWKLFDVAANKISELEKTTLYALSLVMMQINMLKRQETKFSAIVHDLRTPLTVIDGNRQIMELLLKKNCDEQVQHRISKYTTGIEVQTWHAQELIEDLLLLPRLNAGYKGKVKKQDIMPIIRELLRQYETAATARGISFFQELTTEKIMCCCDKQAVKSILYNLLSNALKYTPSGGEITVGVEEKQESDAVLIWVKDTGIGIDEEEQKFIWEKYKGKGPIQHEGDPSSGLGLWMVRELVQKHKGNVSVKSHLGKGSCFTVEFQKAE